jgi:hypothetical protein
MHIRLVFVLQIAFKLLGPGAQVSSVMRGSLHNGPKKLDVEDNGATEQITVRLFLLHPYDP